MVFFCEGLTFSLSDYNFNPNLGFNLLHTAFYTASMSAKFVTDAIKKEIQNGTEDRGLLLNHSFYQNAMKMLPANQIATFEHHFEHQNKLNN